ncbi:16S rRNA (guanine(527)-N(7))-methyltransferase RsmG [Nocardioides sp.]|uniref:16S rRNA (guanine(527)-N(7))-methyltransferase RsmG n=1 Tax=Nocardioides sp. TaxID=35761 RepID=UPI0027338F16|nr:16S rRNA (guanine(527)-N(7))-methyltransferase RsmG [Nocardioides sp.]MDP3890578.1 16S rRNA (guanine(527)-N(7))-methyltransferase RsmG [Nocardioides sp.]
MFGSRLPLAERYVELLATDGVVRGLIGPREAPRLWERHVLNCAVLGEALGSARTVCDIGSGAGLPGLVLAILRPDLSVTLVEPLLRRTTFLEEAVEQLGLDHVEVVRGRADALHGTRRFDAVTSRAVAPLGRLLEWSVPLVAPDGALVALKGASLADEIVEASAVVERLGCAAPQIVPLGVGVLDPPTQAVRVVWADPGRVPLPLAGSSPHGSARSSRARPKQRKRGARD